ncbi:phage head-tail connector protein [Enterococcus sp. MJM12]|uniref:Phage head-tail connector protein n=1 Tax=Candidatus Enterococcus myersii TaxID=2815322 RepID=A0ABS3H5Q1_9ENTE|nr:phage head-tail connector protein [Enterococcus sp. MJM12]MBO0447948.1 phage head-tail connector protein [Enterococcus sp. MJM12]
MDEEKLKEMTDSLAIRLGVSDENEKAKLKGLIEDALILVLDFTGRDSEDIPEQLYYYARQLAVITWNREGNEGEASRSEGGISQTFIIDIPPDIQSGLRRYRVGKVVKRYASKKA